MKSKVRTAHLIAVLAVSTAAILIASEAGVPQPGGLVIHEWGTFTSVAGEDGAAIDWDVLGGKNDLPSFVYHEGVSKFILKASVRMETPVLYFYSPRPLIANVKVGFPDGIITEWYPQAGFQNNRQSGSASAIEWRNIQVEPGTDPIFRQEFLPSHYYAARSTDASPITVDGQHEKFLFYRGVARVEVPLSAKVAADGSVEVANSGTDAAPMVMLFENRGGRVGYRNVGALDHPTTLAPLSLDRSLPELYTELESVLEAQGLFAKEAKAMVATWRDSWFEEGSRLIYIVPTQTVNAMLPLQVDPIPVKTARVFVGRIELITPATKRAITDAALANNVQAALPYGRFVDPILERITREHPEMTTRNQQFRIRVLNARSSAASQ